MGCIQFNMIVFGYILFTFLELFVGELSIFVLVSELKHLLYVLI